MRKGSRRKDEHTVVHSKPADESQSMEVLAIGSGNYSENLTRSQIEMQMDPELERSLACPSIQ
jgi:hypothetical protein